MCNYNDISMMSYVYIWPFNHMMNAAVTCEWFCCPNFSIKLVPGIPSFSLNYILYPSRHTLYQVLTYFLWFLLPFHLAMFSKFLYTTGWCFILNQPAFQLPPEMFYKIKVCRLWWLLHHSIAMVIKPSWASLWVFLGSLSCWKIILSRVL